MGATRIMVIRHAEKPGHWGDPPARCEGVDATGRAAGPEAGKEHLVTRGWQRVGGLVSLFAPLAPDAVPRRPFAVPDHLYASDPGEPAGTGKPSKRPYETLAGLAAATRRPVIGRFGRDEYDAMLAEALDRSGTLLIAWQHEIIPLLLADGTTPGLSRRILDRTGTPEAAWRGWGIPRAWPGDRYDLVLVFDRPAGEGPVTGFTLAGQYLLAGDTDPPG